MALPNVTIIQGNGNIGGVITSDDGIAALVGTGPAPGDYTLGDQLVFFSLADAEAAGFDEDYDNDNSVVVHEHIKSFYEMAGNGAELHFVLFADTNYLDDLVDNVQEFAKVLLQAQAGRIKLLGVFMNPDDAYVPAYTNGIDTMVEAAIIKAQALYDEEFEVFRPVQIFIECRGFQGNVATLADQKLSTSNRVTAVMLAKKEVAALAHAEDYASVGTALGKAAAIPVQRNMGRVKDGALAGNWVLSGNVSVDNLTESQRAAIHDKGYLFAYKMVGLNGYIINDDPTCTNNLDDYNTVARGRVMDKASRLTRQVYVNELKDEVLIDPDTGRMSPSVMKRFQALVEDQINLGMTNAGEISGVNVVVDPLQNVLTTNEIKVTVNITPVGVAKQITATLNFQNNAA